MSNVFDELCKAVEEARAHAANLQTMLNTCITDLEAAQKEIAQLKFAIGLHEEAITRQQERTAGCIATEAAYDIEEHVKRIGELEDELKDTRREMHEARAAADTLKAANKWKSEQLEEREATIKTILQEAMARDDEVRKLSVDLGRLRTDYSLEFSRAESLRARCEALAKEVSKWEQAAWNFEHTNKELQEQLITSENAVVQLKNEKWAPWADNPPVHVFHFSDLSATRAVFTAWQDYMNTRKIASTEDKVGHLENIMTKLAQAIMQEVK